jgi:hypothetical protein
MKDTRDVRCDQVAESTAAPRWNGASSIHGFCGISKAKRLGKGLGDGFAEFETEDFHVRPIVHQRLSRLYDWGSSALEVGEGQL